MPGSPSSSVRGLRPSPEIAGAPVDRADVADTPDFPDQHCGIAWSQTGQRAATPSIRSRRRGQAVVVLNEPPAFLSVTEIAGPFDSSRPLHMRVCNFGYFREGAMN
jgi:hypothetical protein